MCAQTGPTALLILILTQRDRQDIAPGFSPSEEAGKLDALLPLPVQAPHRFGGVFLGKVPTSHPLGFPA